MDPLFIAVVVLVVILFLFGAIGVFIPAMPDTLFVFLGLLVFAIYDRLDRVSIWVYLGLFLLSIALIIVDYVATVVGTRVVGASRWALLGGLLGAIAGVVVGNIVGLFIGFIVGVILAELLVKGDFKKSLQAGGGAILGFLSGVVVKLVMIIAIGTVLLISSIF